MLIPGLFAGVARALRWAGERVRSSSLIVVVSELRAITTRSVALAGIAALAVYGSVAIGGARADLLRGLDANFSEYLHTAADLGDDRRQRPDDQRLQRRRRHARRSRALPASRRVRVYQGGFLDVGARRMWVIARPAGDDPLIPASQLLRRRPRSARRALLRAGGWATISGGFAEEHHLEVGQPRSRCRRPPARRASASRRSLTNLGWSPGAVIINAADYRRYWQTAQPCGARGEPRAGRHRSGGQARRRARARAPPRPRRADASANASAQYAADSRQGLYALSEISTLLLIAAALAVASALSAAIWQRRARLASLKIQGYDTAQLWRALLLESAIVLGIGCAIGRRSPASTVMRSPAAG